MNDIHKSNYNLIEKKCIKTYCVLRKWDDLYLDNFLFCSLVGGKPSALHSVNSGYLTASNQICRWCLCAIMIKVENWQLSMCCSWKWIMFRFTCLLITGYYQLSVGCGWFSAGVQSHRDPSGGDIQISLSTSHSESNPLQYPYSVRI